jgi:uncharacterized protein (DUF58 family)
VRKVESVSPFESFRSRLSCDDHLIFGPLFLVKRHLFNPTSIAAVYFFILMATAPFSRISGLVLLASSAVVGFLYVDLRAKAMALVLRRKIPRDLKFYEGDLATMTIELHNTERFSFAFDVTLEDHLGFCDDPSVTISKYAAIRPRSKITMEYERRCSAEMGSHPIGPLTAKLKDCLGLFEFRVIEDEVQVMELLPRIQTVPPVAVRGSLNSLHYGLYELPSRGLSVNFSGIRRYVQGDSLRHVAWKISGKHQELMVKEFEKVVGCDMSIILDLDPRIHLGLDHGSTWDQAKHVVLSIAKQQLDLGNSIRLFSNGYRSDAVRGGDSIEGLAHELADLVPVADDLVDLNHREILQRAEGEVASSSTLIFVSVFESREIEKDIVTLIKLRERGIQVFVVLIDASSYLVSKDSSTQYYLYLGTRSAKTLIETQTKLRLAGFEVAVLRRGERLVPSSFLMNSASADHKRQVA